MSKLLYSATMSLDGFIAGVGGDMSWLSDLLVESSAPEINDLMNSIGALLVGKNTFTGDDPNKGTDHEGAFGGQWHGPTVVLTHDPEPADHPDLIFSTDLATAVSTAKQAANGKYVNVLGANVAAQCLDAGLLDEVLVFIAPVLLGAGVRLYEHRGGTRVPLEPRHPQRAGPLSLWYRVSRAAGAEGIAGSGAQPPPSSA